jgi:hypothetical protein
MWKPFLYKYSSLRTKALGIKQAFPKIENVLKFKEKLVWESQHFHVAQFSTLKKLYINYVQYVQEAYRRASHQIKH